MNKNYGPKAFEKMWKKSLKDFSEVKIFFVKDGSRTIVKYIDGDKLLGISMYRCHFEIDNWLGHFQSYLDTGVFDTDAYWVKYTSKRSDPDDVMSKLITVYETKVNAVPMVLKNKLWSVHSEEMNKFMKIEREKNPNLGFKQASRPQTNITETP